MPVDVPHVASELDRLAETVGRLCCGTPSPAAQKWAADAAAARFHLQPARSGPAVVVILGGTGTGKSTLLNRLLERTVAASSFRRTFTGGAVAAAADASAVPEEWLAIPRETVTQTPARGRVGALSVVEADAPLLSGLVLVDTPDLDGDTPVHHGEADRAFRWAQAVVFIVTPEKYQMPELIPYYRLARRYGVPTLFVMNKCEEAAVLEDYRQELARLDWADARIFAVPRDDAAYEAPPGARLTDLRAALQEVAPGAAEATADGVARRCADLLSRLRDQVIAPLLTQREQVQRLMEGLRVLQKPVAGVDVSPLTQQLQRHMQEQSVLYLMGPGRVVERVRKLPTLLSRLPKTAWQLVTGTNGGGEATNSAETASPAKAPDFRTILTEQLTIVQSRIDDLLRSGPLASWLEGESGYAATRIDAADAARIADEELAELQRWLEQHWNQSPRDTKILHKVLQQLPGGDKLTQWSEAAPYVLAVVVATHHAFFGPIDLLILGGFGLATWLGEKLSNEVAARTAQANRRIAERFDALANEQVERVCQWLERQVPTTRELSEVETQAERLSATIEP